MQDVNQWLKQLNGSEVSDCATLINGQLHSDYPIKPDGRTLRRLGKSCACVEYNTSGYNTYFGYDKNHDIKTSWEEENIIVAGFTDKVPELSEDRLYLNLKNSLGKNLVITWEDT